MIAPDKASGPRQWHLLVVYPALLNSLSAPGRNFYMTTDGFILTWSVRFDDVTVIPVGRMELNCLSNLVRIGGPYPASHAAADPHHRQMSVGSSRLTSCLLVIRCRWWWLLLLLSRLFLWLLL